MGTDATDVRKVLSYGREKVARQYLTIGIGAAAVGAVLLLVADDGEARIAGWAALVIGGGLAAWEFSRTTRPQKPLLVLSPEGIRMHIEGATEFLIPWTEVRAVERIDVAVPGGSTERDVTAALVTQDFYDRAIHVDSLFLRGPGWGATFVPQGDMVAVALHHAILPVTAEALHDAVLSRWQVFGGKGAAPSPD